MNILRITCCVFWLTLQAPAAEAPSASQTINQLSKSAESQLASSILELNQLRDQIATEKVPLAQELTAAEEKITQLRRTFDSASRSIDSGNFELIQVKAEMKARQDELAYVGKLLDEYARTFDTKVNFTEMHKWGEKIEAAKTILENPELSMEEKFKRQTGFLSQTIARIFDAIGGMRFPGLGVDLQGAVAQGQFAIIGPVALFSAKEMGATGLVVPQTGSNKPLIRPLEGSMQIGIAAIVNDGQGLLPLDPSRGAALKALVQKTNLIHIFEKGGPIMWPLLVASVLALGTVLERLLFLMIEKLRRSPKKLERFLQAVGKGDFTAATEIAKSTRFYVVRALGYALNHRQTSLANAVLYAQARELQRFRRGIPILDTVITLSPLLGLLGTVTGMMGSFSIIGGELSSPGAITGGIAEALIATAFGLGIAITSLLPFNFLNTKLEEAQQEIESAGTQLELLVQNIEHGGAPSAVAAQAAVQPKP